MCLEIILCDGDDIIFRNQKLFKVTPTRGMNEKPIDQVVVVVLDVVNRQTTDNMIVSARHVTCGMSEIYIDHVVVVVKRVIT